MKNRELKTTYKFNIVLDYDAIWEMKRDANKRLLYSNGYDDISVSIITGTFGIVGCCLTISGTHGILLSRSFTPVSNNLVACYLELDTRYDSLIIELLEGYKMLEELKK